MFHFRVHFVDFLEICHCWEIFILIQEVVVDISRSPKNNQIKFLLILLLFGKRVLFFLFFFVLQFVPESLQDAVACRPEFIFLPCRNAIHNWVVSSEQKKNQCRDHYGEFAFFIFVQPAVHPFSVFSNLLQMFECVGLGNGPPIVNRRSIYTARLIFKTPVSVYKY